MSQVHRSVLNRTAAARFGAFPIVCRIGMVAALAVALVAGTGCRGRRVIASDIPPTDGYVSAPMAPSYPAPVTYVPAPGAFPAPPPPMPMGTRTMGPAPMPATMPAMMPAPEEETAGDLAQRESMRRAVESDQVRFLARQKLEAARDLIRNGDYPGAEVLLREALELTPGNTDVRNELRDVEALLGRRGSDVGGMLEEQRTLVKVRIDEQKSVAARQVSLGRIHMQNRRYDEAIEAFEQAQFVINASPYEIDWGTIKTDAEQGLRAAQRAREDRSRQERRESVEQSLDEMARAEESKLIAEQTRLERIMGEAVAAFEREEFELAARYAQQILDEQPDNTKASDLLRSANRAGLDQVERDYLAQEKQAYREWMDEIAATRIPQQKILKWPSQKFWDQITTARSKSRPSFGEVAPDPEADALLAKVKVLTVNLAVDNQPFKDVLKNLQIQTGINLFVDPRIASEVGEAQVTGLYVQDLSLETALNLLQGSAGADVVWTARGNIIQFTKKEFVKKSLVTEIHTVADLTTGLTNFIPPTIQLVGPDSVSDEENPLFGAESEEPVLPYGTIDELIELIKNAVEPAFWGETEGADIKAQGDTLVVRASKSVQDKIAQFLTDLRGFAGIVVTVEARFLEIGDAFLRDVGVDFRGLGNTPVAGNLVNLDDVTNGLEDRSSAGFDNALGIQQAAALSPSAGMYFNDGADGDFRSRTENIFDNSLGTVLSALGGGTFSMTFLDDLDVAMVLRATEKSAQIKTLTAPTITVYNTQRANLTVVNQLSYIQDFDVEVAQTSFIADPIVGIIQDGLTLDVRPTVSNDRRYITLELQPTVADLIEPIPTFATTLASSFSPVIIQLPEVRLQQARTTVRIPDKGTILIGGLKNITTIDRSSETPWFAKLPILSFLFSRKGRSDEVGHLMILVRATITDLAEDEERMMAGRSVGGRIAGPPAPYRLPSAGDFWGGGAAGTPCEPAR